MALPIIDGTRIVRELMDEHPETIAVFLQRRMHCPGCAMSPFMTVAEAAESHAVDADDLIGALWRAVQGGAP